MTRFVQLTAKANADIDRFAAELKAACGFLPVAWFHRLAIVIDSLSELPERCHRAAEADDLGLELRELLFGRRRGTVRILFTIQPALVRVHHLRWAVRRRVRPDDLT